MLLTILIVLVGGIAGIALFLYAMKACVMVLYSCNDHPNPKVEWDLMKSTDSSYVATLVAFGLLFLLILVQGGA